MEVLYSDSKENCNDKLCRVILLNILSNYMYRLVSHLCLIKQKIARQILEGKIKGKICEGKR